MMIKNLNRGFTLIELLVVVAVIGVLSTIVLNQLNTARNRGADASVRSNLNSMRSVAESLYDNGYNGYQAICSDTKMSNPHAAAVAAAGNGGTCASSTGYWVAWAGLKVNTAQAFCVDNTGNAKVITKPVSAITIC